MTIQGMSIGQLWFSFRGRASRSAFWLGYFLPAVVISSILYVVDMMIGTTFEMVPAMNGQPAIQQGIISAVFSVFLIWPYLAVTAKRCHDHGRTGWMQLLILVPLVGPIWYLIYVGFMKGTQGANRFGPDPLLRDQAGGAPAPAPADSFSSPEPSYSSPESSSY